VTIVDSPGFNDGTVADEFRHRILTEYLKSHDSGALINGINSFIFALQVPVGGRFTSNLYDPIAKLLVSLTIMHKSYSKEELATGKFPKIHILMTNFSATFAIKKKLVGKKA